MASIQIEKSGWGDATPSDVEAVCRSVAQVFLADAGIDTHVPILVKHVDSPHLPMTLNSVGGDGTRTILLNVTGRHWAQLAYQFAHHYCHVLTRHWDFPPNYAFRWFEGSLCELAAIYSLRRMSTLWALEPPFPNWASYALKLSDYVESLVQQTPSFGSASRFNGWLTAFMPKLMNASSDARDADVSEDRFFFTEKRIIAVQMLRAFDKHPETWAAIPYLVHANASCPEFGEYLATWMSSVPSKDRKSVRLIERSLGFGEDNNRKKFDESSEPKQSGSKGKAHFVEPRTLKGFRDFLPQVMIPRERIIDTAKKVYRSYGFRPIDTPALEYLDILTGKGSEETDKQLYSFRAEGGRDVGMRFDLTVPLARYVAQHSHELGLPFKRYHIGTVWRGENTQTGRYREFMQCDFDTIGSTDLTSDIEMILVINELFLALGVDRFTIRINHRKLLDAILDSLGFSKNPVAVLRALDKVNKVHPEEIFKEIRDSTNADTDDILKLWDLLVAEHQSPLVSSRVENYLIGNPEGQRYFEEVEQVLAAVRHAGVSEQRVKFDPSIARGLDYYTGLVVETQLDDLPSIGSVCSGGRYDNLASKFTKLQLPGIGASLGLDRFLAAMEQLGQLPSVKTPAPVLICMFDAARRNDYLKLAAQLRAAGIGVEVYPEAKKLGKQLQYADKQGFRAALIAGENEFAAGECQVKDLSAQTSATVAYNGTDAAALIGEIRALLSR